MFLCYLFVPLQDHISLASRPPLPEEGPLIKEPASSDPEALELDLSSFSLSLLFKGSWRLGLSVLNFGQLPMNQKVNNLILSVMLLYSMQVTVC
jgi:hypothetical protein